MHVRGLFRNKAELFLLAGVVVYTLVFTIYCVEKYEFYRTGFFDFGQQLQYVWLLAQGHLTSFVLGRPIMLLVGAAFAVFPQAETLLFVQSFLLATGAVPLYYLAYHKTKNEWVGLAISGIYLVYPALWGINQYEYHNEAVVVPFLMWTMYSYETRKSKSFVVSLLLSLASSEFVVVIAVFIAGAATLDFLREKDKLALRFVLVTFAVTIAFAVYLEITPYLPSYGLSTLTAGGYTLSGSAQFLNPMVVIMNPGYSLAYHWTDKVTYLIFLLAPLMFLPLLSIRKLLPAFPWLGVVATYSPLLGAGGIGPVYQLYSQWSSFLIPFLFVSTACALGRIAQGERTFVAHSLKRTISLMIVITILVSSATGAFSPVSVPINLSGGDSTVPTDTNSSLPYHGVWPTPVVNDSVIASFTSMVPSNYSVLTQNQIGSKLWERTAPIFIFYQPGYKNVQADAILIDHNLEGLCQSCVNYLLSTGNYTLMASYDEGGIYLYYKR